MVSDCDAVEYYQIKNDFSKQLNIPMDWISLYRNSKIYDMIDYGSYFLWHIKLEGVKIYDLENRLENSLNNLQPYQKAKEDILEYEMIYKDIQKSLKEDSLTIDYELNLLASIIRNTAIAIAYMNDEYLFDRYQPVKYCIYNFSKYLHFDLNEYKELYNYRINYNRNNVSETKKNNLIAYSLIWLDHTNDILCVAKNIIESRGEGYGLL